MAYYDSSNVIKLNPRNPNLWGLESQYSNSGQQLSGTTGLGDIYGLDYDREKIEQVFNQATDAQYALTKKENQIAQNQYANNMFANQQSAVEALRQQRNEQISSGMARGLNAAQEQGTILGLQQDASAGALELANQQQLATDKVAAAYAENAISAMQEANSVKQAMASIAAQLYEADMLGYTGELSTMAQYDANASDRYGSELGYEGTKYAADMNYKAAVEAANIQANAQVQAASIAASTSSGGKYSSGQLEDFIQYAADKGKTRQGMMAILMSSYGFTKADAAHVADGYYAEVQKQTQSTSQIDTSKPIYNTPNLFVPENATPYNLVNPQGIVYPKSDWQKQLEEYYSK